MAPPSKQSNPGVKRAIIAFQQPQPSSMYLSLMMELRKSGSSSDAGYRQCSRDRTLSRDQQDMQLPRPFSRAIR
eukprot:6827194-Ditylum_brightwellii.AAC.1